MPNKSLPLAICVIAYLLSANSGEKNLSLISAALTQLGDTLATILALREFSEKGPEEVLGKGIEIGQNL